MDELEMIPQGIIITTLLSGLLLYESEIQKYSVYLKLILWKISFSSSGR